MMVGGDFTARDVQDRLKDKGLLWEKPKRFDGSAVLGEFVLYRALVVDSVNFELKTAVVQKQHIAHLENKTTLIIRK